MTTRRKLLTTFALGAVLAGCSKASSAKSAVLKLSDPGNSGILAYAKREGILEKELKAAGATVQWGGAYASFTATIDAVRSRSVNVLQGAISPAVGYLANSTDLKIFATADRVTDPSAPKADGLVVPGDSPVRTVNDLVGKRVAVNRGGRGEYLFLLALEKFKVPIDAVERVYLNPNEASAAFATGKVDGFWAIVRSYPEVVAKGARVLLNSTDVDDRDVTIWAARTELLNQNPEAIAAFLNVLIDLTEESKREPEKFQNVFTNSGPQATSDKRLADDILTTKYAQVPHAVSDADVANVQSVADFFVQHKLVPDQLKATDAVYVLDRK